MTEDQVHEIQNIRAELKKLYERAQHIANQLLKEENDEPRSTYENDEWPEESDAETVIGLTSALGFAKMHFIFSDEADEAMEIEQKELDEWIAKDLAQSKLRRKQQLRFWKKQQKKTSGHIN